MKEVNRENKRVVEVERIQKVILDILLVPEVGIEPTRYKVPLDFESSTSTSSITPARNDNMGLY